MSRKEGERIYLEEFDATAEFPDGRIKLEIFFQNGSGNKKFVWTPPWEEGSRRLFREGYRIEKANRLEGEEVEKFEEIAEEVIKKEKGGKFSDEVLDHIAKVIYENKRANPEDVPNPAHIPNPNIPKFFRQAGFSEIADELLEKQTPIYEGEVPMHGPWELDQQDVLKKLREMNKDSYRNILLILKKLADPKQYIGDEGKHKAVIERVNKALSYENLKATKNGEIEPLREDD
ncbi:hypothetical protein AKJ41_00660 [candidate division MSBL1 archaeon SCGC-AAA259O05]|uniref:Uncharacterized protein n=1 Tax=candidate division MSBL1 archaeon SCGC-AAA259O05 TaxID=1698271 RepID=A0A133V5I0_9EURY|nr:hypothetical protein AKJ41_00660 [candidate division MSBL1 archaeon SCGC-AAA259O05]